MRRIFAVMIAALALVMTAGVPAYADPDGDGNGNGNPPGGANGTVKIHDWPDHKNSSDMANDPKVCQFEIHGFNFDAGQADDWWIQEHKWGNGDKTKSVLGGSYSANSSGDWTSGPHSLADGHYKLFVEMAHQAGNSGNTVVTYKHKVFKVDCPPLEAGGEEDENGESGEGDSDQTNDSDQANVGGQQQNNAVAGVQHPPMSGAAAPSVAGQQAAPVTSLPSTSTDR